MKRAYTDLALRWHPDRQPEGSDRRERAEFRMREINEAWSVLRSPAARAAYDDSLRPPSVRPRPEPQGVPSSVAELRPQAPPPIGSPRSSAPWGWLTAGVLVVALVLVVTAVLGAERPGDRVELRATEPFAVGSCVLFGGRAEVVEVPCASPGSVRVVDRTTFPRACPRGTRAAVLDDARTTLCLELP